ncbi:hypothetical protein BJL83_23530 [Vibrio parahaemolyticus]|nr:hypothetical protein BJL83_23530 [Vibrio parahaemolyticus]
MNESGRNKMITGLEKSIELFNQVEDILNPITMSVAAKYGLTEEVLENIQKQALEEAKTDLTKHLRVIRNAWQFRFAQV